VHLTVRFRLAIVLGLGSAAAALAAAAWVVDAPPPPYTFIYKAKTLAHSLYVEATAAPPSANASSATDCCTLVLRSMTRLLAAPRIHAQSGSTTKPNQGSQ